MRKSPRCIHRHTSKTHPNCFRRGLLKKEDWWEGRKIGYLDIEASSLDANWGMMLSWCLKVRGDPKVKYDVINKKELSNYQFDKRITQSLIDAMKGMDILVTYYGTGFDIPFIRTRAMYHRLDFPKRGSIYHWDLYYVVRHRMKLSRNSLAVATQFLGIDGKTPIPPEMWFKAKFGDKKALAYVLEHNVADVEILETLHNQLMPHHKWHRKGL